MGHRPSSSIYALFAISVLGIGCSSAADPARASSDSLNAERGKPASPAFLDAADYSDLVTIDPAFPFGVTGKHVAAGAVLGARWGRHGGPLVTTQSFTSAADPLKVIRWAAPSAPTAPATRTELSAVIAPNLPSNPFWGIDGFVDLPFGALAMHAYSSSGAHYAGEVLLYGKDYDRVVGRARANGYYSGVGIGDGQQTRIVYSGLSGLTADPSSLEESGLYASDVCSDSLVPTGACASSVKLFGWSGFSGPVVTDNDGNVFVAASLSGGSHTDAVYGLTKAQAFAGAPQAKATVVESDSSGTGSLTAVSTPGSHAGWIVAKGYDGETSASAYARAYRSTGATLEADGALIPSAIVPASSSVSLSVFSDPTGHLWVAVESAPDAWLLELQPKP